MVTQNMLLTYMKENRYFPRRKKKCEPTLDLIKCLQHFAPFVRTYELPSNISTMTHMPYLKDKQGMSQSILRIPTWVLPDMEQVPLDWEDRGTADGRVENWSPLHSPANRSPQLLTAIGLDEGTSPVFTTTNPILYHHQGVDEIPDRGRADGSQEDEIRIISTDKGDQLSETPLPDSDFDEFDSNEEEEDSENRSPNSQDNEIHEIYYQEKQVAVIGQCRALYDYTANMYDELTIRYGDVINIHDKQEDDWWLGECDGKVGIFPATYVEAV